MEQSPTYNASRIVLVAALREEIAPLVKVFNPAVILHDGRKRYYKVDYRGKSIVLARVGMGQKNIVDALEFLLQFHKPELVISLGFAGALSRNLRVGDLVLIRGVIMFPALDRINLPLLSKMSGTGNDKSRRLFSGVCLTLPRVHGKEKLSNLTILKNKVAVVDLEAYFCAKYCLKNGIPLVVVRAVSDAYGESFQFSLSEISDEDNHVSAFLVARLAARSPSIILHFWDLWRKSRKASLNLRDFVLNCCLK